MDIILNLLCWINTWPNRMVFREDGLEFALAIYETYDKIIDICYLLQNVFLHIQSLSSICICFHRLSTALFENSNKFWNRYYLLIYAFLVIYSFLAVQLLNRAPIKFNYEQKMFYSEILTKVRFQK